MNTNEVIANNERKLVRQNDNVSSSKKLVIFLSIFVILVMLFLLFSLFRLFVFIENKSIDNSNEIDKLKSTFSSVQTQVNEFDTKLNDFKDYEKQTNLDNAFNFLNTISDYYKIDNDVISYIKEDFVNSQLIDDKEKVYSKYLSELIKELDKTEETKQQVPNYTSVKLNANNSRVTSPITTSSMPKVDTSKLTMGVFLTLLSMYALQGGLVL